MTYKLIFGAILRLNNSLIIEQTKLRASKFYKLQVNSRPILRQTINRYSMYNRKFKENQFTTYNLYVTFDIIVRLSNEEVQSRDPTSHDFHQEQTTTI